MGDLNWTDDQWRKVNDAVNDAFGKASVASAFLPLYGPLSPGAEMVRNERLTFDDSVSPPVVALDSSDPSVNQQLVTLTVKVQLSSEQVADENLANALLAFRRAANVLAQNEDAIVFNGYAASSPGKPATAASTRVKPYLTSGPDAVGLVDIAQPLKNITTQFIKDATGKATKDKEPVGPLLVPKVVEAITHLEKNSNPGPFACVLDNKLFEAAHEPSSFSLVLPSDRLLPLLKGPLLRCSQLPDNTGVVVALSANAVDLVVATPPIAQFLQRNENAKYMFRVYTRFALRIRDTGPSAPVVQFEKK